MNLNTYKVPFLIYFSTFFCLIFSYGMFCHFYLVNDVMPKTDHASSYATYQQILDKTLAENIQN